jgi:hypothetical protein
VFVAQRVTDTDVASKPTWAHVKFAQPLADGRRFATALVRAGQAVEPGDLVQMRLRPAASSSVAVAQEPNHITAVIATHGTVAARRPAPDGAQPLERPTQAGD